jgi:RHS repeat-associated protein
VVLSGNGVSADLINGYRFNGQEYQDELGLNLYDMDYRDYDPAIGRWTGIDPVTHFDQSTYMAMNGNPVMFADPSGAEGVRTLGASSTVFGMAGQSANANQYKRGHDGFGNANYVKRANWYPDKWGQVADGNGWSVYTTTNRSEINSIIGYYARESGYSGFSFTYTDKDSGMDDKGAVGFYQYKRGSSIDSFGNGKSNNVHIGRMLPNFKADIGGDLLSFKGLHYGVPEFETSLLNGHGAVTPGPFVLYPTGGSSRPYYNTHEPGHALQFMLMGPLQYYSLIAIPSAIDAKIESREKASYFYTEITANQLWNWFTGESHSSNPR